MINLLTQLIGIPEKKARMEFVQWIFSNKMVIQLYYTMMVTEKAPTMSLPFQKASNSIAAAQPTKFIQLLQKVFELSWISRNNFCLAIEKYTKNPGPYDDERIGIFLVLGRKGFDVAEFRKTNFNNYKLTRLFNKENTKFTSFPKDSCDLKPQNTKTAYFYEK